MNIKQAIEEQRSVLDKMAENATHLTELLEEARKMDRFIEAYETEVHTTASGQKMPWSR